MKLKARNDPKSTPTVKFDYSQYRQSFKIKDFFKLLLLFSILYIGNAIFELDRTIVDKWLHNFPQNIVSTLILISLLVFVTCEFYKNWKSGLRPTIISLCTSLLMTILYITWSRTNNNFEFYSLYPFTRGWIYFFDIFVAIIAIYFLDFRAFSPTSASEEKAGKLIYDNPSVLSQQDLIQNGNYAAHLAKAIERTSGEGSFTIGVFGPWGSGKTDFLLRLKAALTEHKEENIVLEFNPWRSSIGGSEPIVVDFFQMLGKELSKYNRSVSKKIKSYSKKVVGASKDIPFLVTELSLSGFTKDATTNQEFDELNSIIKSTGKRVIILIDDLDRMSGDEIISVFALVRNVAYFDNTFFVLSIDYEYVVGSIQLTNKFAKPSQYLDKIFQLTINIPKIRKTDFSSTLINLLEQSMGSSINESDFQTLTINIKNLSYEWPWQDLNNDEGILESLLDNYRDIKRFCNSIIINYPILKDEIYLQDFILLELIKTTSGLVYELIGSKRIIKISERGYLLNDDATKYLRDKLHIDEGKFKSLENALTLLFVGADYNIPRKISHPETFHLYFSYHLYNLISLKEFRKLYEEETPEKIAEQFNTWINEKKEHDLDTFLNTQTDFYNSDAFNKLTRASILIKENEKFLNRASIWILKRDSVFYFKREEDYKEYIQNLLKDNSLPIYNRAYVATELLKYALKRNADFVLHEEELKNIIYILFDEFLNSKIGYDISVKNFYLLNVDNTNTNQIKLTKKAHTRLKEFLLDNSRNLEDFLLVLIRPYEATIREKSNFTFNPFMREIFEDLDELKRLVKSHEFSEHKFDFLKNIILDNIETDIFPIHEPSREKFISTWMNMQKNKSL